MSQAEFDFYKSASGLPASAKLEEHQRAFWCAQLAVAYPSFERALGELELAFMVAEQPALAGLTLDDARLRYFQTLTGLPAGLAATDYMQAAFTTPLVLVLTTAPPNPVSVAVNPTVTFTATVSGLIPARVELWHHDPQASPGVLFDDFTLTSPGVWQCTLDVSTDAGATFYWTARALGRVSNQVSTVIVA